MTTQRRRVSIEGNPEYDQFWADVLPQRWNGWAIPLFSREEAQRVMNMVNGENDDYMRLRWEGDTVVLHYFNTGPGETHEGYRDERIEPDEQGRYNFGLGWVWYEVDDNEEKP